MEEEKNKEQKQPIIEIRLDNIHIPEACKDGTCEHGKEQKKVKSNIGL